MTDTSPPAPEPGNPAVPPPGAGEKALEVALEIDKQIIAIAVGVLTISGTFVNPQDHMANGPRAVLAVCWGAFVLAVIFGVAVLMNVAGILTKGEASTAMARPDLKRLAGLQIIVFLIGVIALGLFGFMRLF
jgi:hypothetical protein